MCRQMDPVGVFDSGIGGISALIAMRRLLPREKFIYFGDTENAPYGTKDTEEVIRCVRAVVNRLTEQRIKALVIACNTATGAAAAVLRRELTIPVIASGGAGRMEDFRDVFAQGHADAALAASVFHFGQIGIPELKEYLRKEGINVRL